MWVYWRFWSRNGFEMRFDKVETVTVCIFTVEYVGIRLFLKTCWLESEVLRFGTRSGSCFSRMRWVVLALGAFEPESCSEFTNFFSIVDLVSILPFYVDLAIPGRQSYLATQWVRVARG